MKVYDTVFGLIENHKTEFGNDPGIIIILQKWRSQLEMELFAAMDGDKESVRQGMESNHFAIYNTYTIISPREDFDIVVY